MSESILLLEPMQSPEERPPAIWVKQAAEGLRERFHACEEKVRQSPTQSILIAAAAGYTLQRLPVRALVTAQLSLMTALLPPAIFWLGSVQLWSLLKTKSPAEKRH